MKIHLVGDDEKIFNELRIILDKTLTLVESGDHKKRMELIDLWVQNLINLISKLDENSFKPNN